MPRGNINNLKTLSSEEAREQGRKGGIASAKARAEKKAMMEEMQAALQSTVTDKSGTEMSVQRALCLAQIQKALKGDTRSAEFVRDTSGQKPVENINAQFNQEVVIDFSDIEEEPNED